MIGAVQATALREWSADDLPLTLVMTTTAPNETITIPCNNVGTFNAVIDWGDGSSSTITAYNDAGLAHVYASSGDKQIKITGDFPNIYFNNGGDRIKLKAVRYGNSHLITSLVRAFASCNALTELAKFNTTGVVSALQAFVYCYNLTSFPAIDLSNCTSVEVAWSYCTGLRSFPALNLGNSLYFVYTWEKCEKLTAFPFMNVAKGRLFTSSWTNCSLLRDFPAGMFDGLVNAPLGSCFTNTWKGCTALTTQSVENILVSIATSGKSAPASGVDITIDYNAATGALTSATTTAITTLKSRGWTVTINGVAQ